MIKRILVSATLMTLVAAPILADAFNPKVVPADAKWVLHVDVDAVAISPFWELIQSKLDANPQAQAGIQQLEMVTGVALPQDLHAVTVYGMGFEEADGVVLIKAKFNQDQLLGLFQMNPAYSNKAHGTHQVISWEDKGKVNYGSFYSADLTIVGQSEENVTMAINVLDAKGETIKADSLMAQPVGANVLAFVASNAVSQLDKKNKNNPVLKNFTSGSITLSEMEKKVTLKANLACLDAKMAEQMKTMAEGFKAMGIVFANGENVDPKLKVLAQYLPGVSIATQDNQVQLAWLAPYDQVKGLIETLPSLKDSDKQNKAK